MDENKGLEEKASLLMLRRVLYETGSMYWTVDKLKLQGLPIGIIEGSRMANDKGGPEAQMATLSIHCFSQLINLSQHRVLHIVGV